MKAIFKGSTGNDHLVKRKFTIGKEYDLQDAGFGFHITEDDYGRSLIFQNGVDYTFELVIADSLIKSSVCSASTSGPSLKFYINGFKVSEEELVKIKSLISGLDAEGVKCDTIKFEVKFE